MEENKDQGFTPPPTSDEVAPEPKVYGKSNNSHYLIMGIIAVAIILIGGFFILIYSGDNSEEYDSKSVTGEESGSDFITSTMVCESFEDSVCKKKAGNNFMKEESIFIATKIMPNVDRDLEVDLLFVADIILPDGERVENVKQYNFKETIPQDTFSSYLIELTPDEGDSLGEYTFILELVDNFGGPTQIVEETFVLYDNAR